MSDGKLKCPKCGSNEIMEISPNQFFCQNCYNDFEIKTNSQSQKMNSSNKQQHAQKEEPPKLKKCPYCTKLKPVEDFKDGICKDCYPKFRSNAAQSEARVLTERIKEEERAERRTKRYMRNHPILNTIIIATSKNKPKKTRRLAVVRILISLFIATLLYIFLKKFFPSFILSLKNYIHNM